MKSNKPNSSYLSLASSLMLIIICFIGLMFFQHINAVTVYEKDKIIEKSRNLGLLISRRFSDFYNQFEIYSESAVFENIFNQEFPYPIISRKRIRRFYSSYQDILEEICVFNEEGKFKTVTRTTDNYYDISKTFKENCPYPFEKKIEQTNDSIIIVLDSQVDKKLKIAFKISPHRCISSSIFAYSIFRKTWSQLILTEKVLESSKITLGSAKKLFPQQLNFELSSDQLKRAQDQLEDISEVMFYRKGTNHEILLTYSPVRILDESFSLFIGFKKEEVLSLVYSSQVLFSVIFCFLLLFSLLFITLRKTLDNRTYLTKELQKQRNIFSNLIESMPIGIAVKNFQDDMKYLICNPALSRMFNLSIEKIEGKVDKEILPTELAENFKTLDDEVIETVEPVFRDKILMNFGKGGVWIRANVFPVLNASGKIIQIMHLLEDVTEGVKLEQQLHHAQRMDEMGKLAGGIAHEFNNLLQVILGYSELTASESDDSFILENLEQIQKAGKSAMKLTRQLLTYSRKTEFNKKQHSLGDIVKSSLRMTQRVLGEDITVSLNQPENLILVEADANQIDQILMNMCINARDAMEGKGQIEITLSKVQQIEKVFEMGIVNTSPQGYAKIYFADNGPGIPKNLINHVFEPFFTTKEVGKGTGLGLATVYAILKQHGGFIFIDSNYESGAAFEIFLPLSTESVELIDTSNNKSKKTDMTIKSDFTILVAEDEDSVRAMCVKLLKRNGYKVLIATNGEEAIEIFNQHKEEVSMLLFDVMMPKLNGKEAYEEIKKIKPEIPILFCTGYSDRIISPELLESKNVELLTKPYKTGEMISLLDSMLKKS